MMVPCKVRLESHGNYTKSAYLLQFVQKGEAIAAVVVLEDGPKSPRVLPLNDVDLSNAVQEASNAALQH